MWMGIALLAAKRSTCYRGNVGCVIVESDIRPVSIGYNGPPSGEPHCKGNNCEISGNGGCLRSLHAEENALSRFFVQENPFGGAPHYYDLYVTASPCEHCARKIVTNGKINRVFYQSPYRLTTGIDILHENKIEVFRLSPSGYLVNEKTGTVLEAN